MPIPHTPLLSVDCVLFDESGRVLLVTRKGPPYQGQFALPGGFVEIGESVEEACRRELMEETGLAAGELALIGVYSDPARDPRGHVCSIVFGGFVSGHEPRAGDDAAAAAWVKDWRQERLAFDHRQILEDAARQLLQP